MSVEKNKNERRASDRFPMERDVRYKVLSRRNGDETGAGKTINMSSNGVLFTTDDCDAFFERVRATGAEVLQEPIDQPYGVRDCAFRDPSGNHVRIGSPIPQPS